MSLYINIHPWDFPGGPVNKISPPKAGDAGSIPGLGNKDSICLATKKSKHKTEAILQEIK